MYCRSRPQYRVDLGWILGVAFLGTLTRSTRPAQGFTFIRCCSTPKASFPHDLATMQLPSACGCYQLAPQRTFTSYPGSMPDTPRVLAALASPPATDALDPDRFPHFSCHHAVEADLLHFGCESAMRLGAG